MRVKVAHSEDPSTGHAVREVLDVLEPEGRPAALLVFAAMLYEHDALLAGLLDALGDVPLIGCSTDGELSSAGGFDEDSVVVVAFYEVQARVGAGRPLSSTLDLAVSEALSGVEGAGLAVVFPPGVALSGTLMVEQLERRCPEGVTIVGATAADQWTFRCSLQFCGREVAEDLLPVLWLGGVTTDLGIAAGWEPVGPAGVVTDASHNLVRTIDGVPALSFFRRHFGDQHEPAPEFPLAMGQELRSPLSYDAKTGSVTFAASIPVGAEVRIAVADTAGIIEGSRASVTTALAHADAPELLLFFSCAARKHVLGTRTPLEEGAIRELSSNIPFAGFYGYGEFVVQRGRAEFFNETLVTVAIRDPR